MTFLLQVSQDMLLHKKTWAVNTISSNEGPEKT